MGHSERERNIALASASELVFERLKSSQSELRSTTEISPDTVDVEFDFHSHLFETTLHNIEPAIHYNNGEYSLVVLSTLKNFLRDPHFSVSSVVKNWILMKTSDEMDEAQKAEFLAELQKRKISQTAIEFLAYPYSFI